MANVGAGTTFATPLVYPATSRIDRSPGTGNLYALFRSSTADLWELWRSTNNGASWALSPMPIHLSRANVQEAGSLIVYEPFGFWCYRTNEGGQDRIYYRRFEPDRGWHSELLVAAVPTGGFTGGVDMQVVGTPYGIYVAIAVGVTVGAQIGMQLFGVWVSPAGAPQVFNELISGPRQWLTTGAGRVGVSLDIEHSGDPHSTAGTGSVQESVPHLWAAFGRTNMYAIRCGWNGYGWNPPTDAVKLNPATLAAQDQITGRWDGWRFVTVAPDPTATDTVAVYERARPNSSTAIRRSQVHPTGVVRNCSFNYNEVTQDIRVYAVGTATTVLYFCDYIRATNTWSAWSTVSVTAVLGATGLNYSPRRGSRGARYDILTAHAGAPNTVVHTGQSLSYPPNVPTWNVAGMAQLNGAAADVAVDLLLDWNFSDPDPADVQSAYAISRQIGAGAVAYWRNSDSTWQPAEVQNSSATSSKLLLGWTVAGAADPPHTYRVKVWDSASVASIYSDAYVVVPSFKSNPTISTPTGGSTITGDTVTPTWTVADQSAYRLTLLTNPGGILTYDSGWVTSTATTANIPTRLADGSGWTLNVQTRNGEGLSSNVATVNFTVEYVEPPAPVTVATPVPGIGSIVVTAVNAAAVGSQPVVADQEIYRRPVVYTNLLTNSGFEADLSTWTPAGCVAVRSTAQAHSGTASAFLTPNGVDATPRIDLASASMLDCVPGDMFIVDGWLRPTTANKPIRVGINWYTSALAYISTSLIDLPPIAGAWLYSWLVAMAPATASKLSPHFGVTNTPAAGDTVYVDDVRCRRDDPSVGVRVATSLASGGAVSDWGPAHGVEYEYRSIARGTNGTSIAGPWLA